MDEVWYLAICVQCNGGLTNIVERPEEFMPMPFDDQDKRTSWVNTHMDGTGHSVLLLNQQYETTKQQGAVDDRRGQ